MQVSGFTPRNANVIEPNQAALATAASGGSIANGTYFVKVTALLTSGESAASNEQSITTTGTGISTVTVTWSAVAGATGYKVYFGSAGSGSENVFSAFGLVTTNTFTALPVTSGTPPTLQSAPNAAVSGAVGTSQSAITLPNAPYPSETVARFIVAGSNTGNVISWCYGNNANLTGTNGCIQLCNTVEIFGIPQGVTQISCVAGATGSTLFIVIGDGL